MEGVEVGARGSVRVPCASISTPSTVRPEGDSLLGGRPRDPQVFGIVLAGRGLTENSGHDSSATVPDFLPMLQHCFRAAFQGFTLIHSHRNFVEAGEKMCCFEHKT